MAKDPSMPFYVNEWLSSAAVICMSLAEQGAYVRLLCYCWSSQEAAIPDDDTRLAAMSGMGEGWFNGGSHLVRKCFEPHPNQKGMLTNKRLFEIWNERVEWKEKSAAAGRASGDKRRKSSSEKKNGNEPTFANGSYLVRTKLQPNCNSSSSSLSSSPSVEERKIPKEDGFNFDEGISPTNGGTFLTGYDDQFNEFWNNVPSTMKCAIQGVWNAFQDVRFKISEESSVSELEAGKTIMRRLSAYLSSARGKKPKHRWSIKTFLVDRHDLDSDESWHVPDEELIGKPTPKVGPIPMEARVR